MSDRLVPEPHRFVELFDTPTELEDWLAAFCGRRPIKTPVEPAFPSLMTGDTPAEWLVRQFDLLASHRGMRDVLRRAIVSLIATHGSRERSLEVSDQIVGTLLDVAGELEFVEITRYLTEWVRKSWFREPHWYDSGPARIPLRRTVWSLLIGWGAVDGVLEQLTRELSDLALSNEPGTAQLCFVALGERDPGEALRLIPRILETWHEAYAISTIEEFFRSVGAHALLSPRYEAAWSDCLGPCLYGQPLERKLRDKRPYAEEDTNRENRFDALMARVGIVVVERAIKVELSYGSSSLEVNCSKHVYVWENAAAIPKKARPVVESSR